MCGRYTNTVTDPTLLAETFNLSTVPDASTLQPRYNIAPTQLVMTVGRNPAEENSIAWMKWGLIPRWAKDSSFAHKLINARAETLSEKPSFRESFLLRRCLIVADGFYEWRKDETGRKVPMYIRLANGQPFGLAGLWDRWVDPTTKESVLTCTIITTHPNDLIKTMHHRMAVILPPEHFDLWLDRNNQDHSLLSDLLRPYPSEDMVAYEVSPKVNNPNYDAPELIEPVA
ncbi:MAG: hypothetical protein CUN55_05460 [Phototrophicales bacterium]|nr:MAG: hypothetical protein CUN55_05460 [Phototrophicales bacterium]